MFKSIIDLFKTTNHKEIMLVGLFISSIILYSGLSLLALYMEVYNIFFIKSGIVAVLFVLLSLYLRSKRTSLCAIVFMVLIDVESSFAVINKQAYEFITVYPFLIIFGFFFFFRLRTALIMTGIHLLYWISFTVYRIHEVTDHPLNAVMVPDFNMFTTSFAVIILGVFYNLSTEVPYSRLEQDDRVKTFLLQEIHHRIKNNLNIIASILGIQMLNIRRGITKDAYEVLHENKLRIESIAMIHESLYKGHRLDRLGFHKYVSSLTTLINEAYEKDIAVLIEADSITFPTETMFRLGIILNELFTNSIKYAFTSDEVENSVKITLTKETNDQYTLIYHEDNNPNIDLDRIENSASLGMRLIRLSVQEMDGTVEISHDGGLLILIRFNG